MTCRATVSHLLFVSLLIRLLTFGAAIPLVLEMLYVGETSGYVCRALLATLLFGLYVCIRLVQQCRDSSEHAEITKSLSSLGCLRGGGWRGLQYGHLVLNGGSPLRLVRLRYVSITFESTLQIP